MGSRAFLTCLLIAGFPGDSAIVLNQSVWRKTHYWLSCQVNGKVKAKCRKVNAVFFLNGGHDCFLRNSINFVIDFSPGKYADILKVLVLDKPKALSASSPLSTFWRPFKIRDFTERVIIHVYELKQNCAPFFESSINWCINHYKMFWLCGTCSLTVIWFRCLYLFWALCFVRMDWPMACSFTMVWSDFHVDWKEYDAI